MAENSENVEAKLCAYVEGDLDESDRVEIENHLEAHPKHRHLLGELAATRDLLRYLPREQAPVELAETFNGQLERSGLLDPPGADSPAASVRGNLLTRFYGLAAILILAVLLGLITYAALPRGGSIPLALPLTTAPTRLEGVLDDPAPADAAAGTVDQPPSHPGRSTPTETGGRGIAKGDKSVPPGGRGPLPGADEAEAVARRPSDGMFGGGLQPGDERVDGGLPGRAGDGTSAGGGGADPGGGGSLGGSAGTGRAAKGRSPVAEKHGGPPMGGSSQARNWRALAPEPVYVIVSAPDPTAAVSEVMSNLRSNRVQWVETQRPLPGALEFRDNEATDEAADEAADAPLDDRYAQLQFNNAMGKKRSYQRQVGRPQQAAARTDVDTGLRGSATRRGAKDGRAEAKLALEAGARGSAALPKKQKHPGLPTPPAAAGASAEPPPAGDASAEQQGVDTEQDPAADSAPAEDEADASPRDFSEEKREAAGRAGNRRAPADAEDDREAASGAERAARRRDKPREVAAGVPIGAGEEQLKALQEQQEQQGDENQQEPADQQEQQGQIGRESDGGRERAEPLDPSTPDLRCILAYDMTPRQAIELSEALARGGRQQVELIADQAELQSLNRTLQVQAGASPGSAPGDGPASADKAVQVGVDTETEQQPKSSPAPAARPRARATKGGARGPGASGGVSERGGGESAASLSRRVTASTRPAVAKAGAAQKSLRQGAPRMPSRVRAGERLRVTVDELAGPDTEKTIVATVARDGTARLTQIPPVRVAGLTVEQAERAIADAYREARVIDSPTVSVERLQAVARAEPERVKARSASKKLAPAAARAQAPAQPAPGGISEAIDDEDNELATAPATAAEAAGAAAAPDAAPVPADAERVDVVILVQSNAMSPVRARAAQANESAAPADAAEAEPAPGTAGATGDSARSTPGRRADDAPVDRTGEESDESAKADRDAFESGVSQEDQEEQAEPLIVK